MAKIVLYKGADTKIVSLGPSLHFCLFDFLYLFYINLRKEAFIMLFIQILSSFILLCILAHRLIEHALITFPELWFIYLVYLISSPLLLWYPIRFFIYLAIFSIVKSEIHYISEIIGLILLTSLHVAVFLISILSCNKWYCKKLLEEGYSPNENDIYSQQLLQYYQKKF